MIYLPVCFFSLFLAYQYKKSGISVGFYIIALYVMISIFSVVMDKMGLIYPEKRNISVITGVIYCGLLFLIISPFCGSKINRIERIVVNNPKVTDGLTFFFFGYFYYFLT